MSMHELFTRFMRKQSLILEYALLTQTQNAMAASSQVGVDPSGEYWEEEEGEIETIRDTLAQLLEFGFSEEEAQVLLGVCVCAWVVGEWKSLVVHICIHTHTRMCVRVQILRILELIRTDMYYS